MSDAIVLHYCISRRDDTDYWRANRHNPHIPPRLTALLAQWRHRSPDAFDNTSGFDFFNRLPIEEVHATALAASIDHVEFLRAQYGR